MECLWKSLWPLNRHHPLEKLQKTINIETASPVDLSVEGRHDPCIIPRAVPVIESVLAIALLDAMMDEGFKF